MSPAQAWRRARAEELQAQTVGGQRTTRCSSCYRAIIIDMFKNPRSLCAACQAEEG